LFSLSIRRAIGVFLFHFSISISNALGQFREGRDRSHQTPGHLPTQNQRWQLEIKGKEKKQSPSITGQPLAVKLSAANFAGS